MSDDPVPATAPPNDLPIERLRVRPGADGTAMVDPPMAGWRYLSFRTQTLTGSASITIGGPDHETAVVNLVGGDLAVDEGGGDEHVLTGRPTVFEALPSAFYLPAGRTATITLPKARSRSATTVAIATAPTRPTVSAGLSSVSIRPDDIRVEVRGAGRSTRQINHIIGPDFPADRLLLVEVLTPPGNWSSWPPHKHDVDDMPDEAVYHYRFRRSEAWAIRRVYRLAGGPLGAARDAVFAVRDGEIVLVTDGYHPFAATDADDAYYLNALAGDRRTMACSFDPDLDHVRTGWSTGSQDPRVPMVRTRSTG